MDFEIKNKPDYASLHVTMDTGEKVVTETGAMMGMSASMQMESNVKGGLMGGLSRMIGGESLFLNTYTAAEDGSRLDVAPSMPGDMVHIELNGNAVMVQSGSYCANSGEIEVDSKWGGAKSFFSGEGLIMLRCHGTGNLWVSSYGAIHEVQVNGTYTVDTTHIVAFDESLTYGVVGLGNAASMIFGGEGLVCKFQGTGRVWFQTRSAPSLASFIHPFRALKPSNN